MDSFRVVAIILFLLAGISSGLKGQIYLGRNGEANFISDAPLEFITASSDELSAAINFTDNTFAFKINNKSFIGFNSALQQEHFNENYIESDKYNSSSFLGKIIEKVNPDSNEPQEVRAKGVLSIHGVEQERIIKATVHFIDGELYITSSFEVPIADHNIRIPNIVYQKIAEVVVVEVSAELNLKTD